MYLMNLINKFLFIYKIGKKLFVRANTVEKNSHMKVEHVAFRFIWVRCESNVW
jgi:hypothetical protein